MTRIVFHVDIDAFFASVEQMDRPELKGKPVIVGASPGQRGVVSTCSYEARAFGVRSAMPISEAFRRCPDGIFLPVRMERYAELSCRVMAILGRFTPDVRQVSVDEAFLDMTGTELLWGRPEEAARRLKEEVFAGTGLSISVGAATNRYVAKIASGLRKPDGLVLVAPGEEASFMLGLPLTKLWGAGERTQERFRELGILGMAQLASFGEAQLESLFGKAGGRFLHTATRGRDPGIMGAERGSHSMSAETTFERDLSDRDSLEAVLMGLAEELSYRLWAEGFRSRTIVLKLRYHDFSTLSRRSTKPSFLLSSAEAYKEAAALFERIWDGRTEVRLVGLGFADLEAAAAGGQGELFADASERIRRAEAAVFEIERKGLGRVTRARLIGTTRGRGMSGKVGEADGDAPG
jgi:DNA polymerase-4